MLFFQNTILLAPIAHCELLRCGVRRLSWPVMFESVASFMFVVLSPRVSPSVIILSLRCYAGLGRPSGTPTLGLRSPRRQCPLPCVVRSFGFFFSPSFIPLNLSPLMLSAVLPSGLPGSAPTPLQNLHIFPQDLHF